MKIIYKTKNEWRVYEGSPAFVLLFLEANYGQLFTKYILRR
jgi:hypothetical protein